MFGFIDSSGSACDAMALTRNPFVRTSGAAGLRQLNVDSGLSLLIGPCPFPSVNLAGFPTDVGHRLTSRNSGKQPSGRQALNGGRAPQALNPNER
jgi:hypothetical protein